MKGIGKNFLPPLGKALRAVVGYNDTSFFQLLIQKYSLVNIQDQSDTIQKPFKHPQTNSNHPSIQFVRSIQYDYLLLNQISSGVF